MAVRRATLALCARARAISSGGAPATSSSSARPAAARAFCAAPVPPSSAPVPPPPPPASGGGGGVFGLAVAGLAGAGALYYAKEQGLLPASLAAVGSASSVDYAAVRKAVADVMADTPLNYDDGSYGPVLVRLAWHSSGTFDKATNSGGSDGGTMRFAPEANHGANAGLSVARDLLEPVKKKFPGISYADLYTLAGAVAIEEMGGPSIPWRPGRTDAASGAACPPDGRLPDAAKDQRHIRDVFERRMGFTARETVALIGAHALGRCHTDRSGYDGPWTYSPTTFSNDYYEKLLDKDGWRKKKWAGPTQYENKAKDLMMLPTDMALVWDAGYKKLVEEYAKNEDGVFEKDFAAAFGKLLELGVKREAATA